MCEGGMNKTNFLSVLALIFSTVALLFSTGIPGRLFHSDRIRNAISPLGTSIDKYDLSTPELALSSFRKMAQNEDIRAAWQYFSLTIDEQSIKSKEQPTTALLFGSPSDVKFIKTFEIKGATDPEQNGKVVAFIKYKINGVEYHPVMYFRKMSNGMFSIDSRVYFGYDKSKLTDEEKSIEYSIDHFGKTGDLESSAPVSRGVREVPPEDLPDGVK